MEWLMMNAYGVHSYSENLGYFLDGSYIIADECQETLLDILEQMQSEDPVTWQLRRQMALAEILTKDFVPLLLNLDPEEHAEIFQLMMIVLADLSQPQMCLMTHSRSTHGFLPNKQPMKIQELSKLHNDAQQMFLNEDLVKEVFNNIRSIISQKEPLTDQQIAAIVHFFLLIRNLLHTPDGDRDSQTDSMSSQQYRLFRNFLRFGLGDILISSLAIQQWEAFSEVAVHLLSVMFKEQVDLLHDRTTQELVSLRSEREGLECMSDSLSADRNDGLKNENGGEFPGVSTDNNKVPETNMSGEMVVSLPESGRNSVDFQPGTDVPILGGDSGDSANTCGPENKYFDEQKQRRSLTELVSVIRCMEETLSVTDTSGDSMLQPGQDVNQVSTALDSSFKEIRIQLQEFAVEFVQTSFSKLVLSFLNRQLQCKPDADSTLYIWMTAYFLTFSRTNDIEYDFISEVFLREVLAAITYQGLRLCSQISQSDTGQQDHLQDLYKKLHLVVCIFKEVFRILHNYASDIHSTEMEKALSSIQDDLALMKGLRQLFVIIIRTCKIAQQGHIFLSEAMETNHCLLVCLDSAIHQRKTTLRLVDHIQQFASRPVMENYGHMLTYFKTNNPDLNSAIFTMMHHVAGDCGKAETLLQPTVLNSLTAVSDDGYPITQDINDLLEYVFGIFIHCVQSSPESVAQLFFPSDDEEEEEEGFSEEEKDLAISLCMDCQENDDVAKVIRSKLELNGVSKSEEQVFKFLETMGYVSSDKDTDCATDADSGFQSDSADGTSTYEIQTKNCVDKLRAMHMGRSIEWLQTSLVEAWNAKLALAGVRPSKQGITWEPWPFFSLAQDKHVPLLVTNDDHQAAVDLPLFSCLAGALDLRLEGNNSFSIPKTWSAETLLNKARLLGDLNYDDMLFTIEEFEAHLSQKQSEFTHPFVNDNEDNNEKPMSLPKVFWPAAVQKLNRVWSPGNGFTGTNCTSE